MLFDRMRSVMLTDGAGSFLALYQAMAFYWVDRNEFAGEFLRLTIVLRGDHLTTSGN
jgi:hypothetical protein